MEECEREPLRSSEASEPNLLQEKEQLIILEGHVNYLRDLVMEMYSHDIEYRDNYLNNLYQFKQILKSLRQQIDDIQA